MSEACEVSSKIKDFYNSLAKDKNSNSLTARRSTAIYFLRNFNNWTKSVFINTYVDYLKLNDKNIRVLDLCCGKGGDQLKWLCKNIKHVTFIDISKDSIDICQQRYSQLSRRQTVVYSSDFFVCDCFNDDLPNLLKCDLYDLVSCQFALHYSFETISKARKILFNISSLLESGGIFIASFPNSYELVKRAKQAYFSQNEKSSSVDGAISFGNSIYSINFPSSSYSVNKHNDQLKFPLFGAQYTFRLDGVVDCPEFLVYPPLLDKLASEYGLVPIQKPITFSKHFNDAIANGRDRRQSLHLLGRMEALKSLCIGSNDFHASSEYDHVTKYAGNSRFVGTLSSSEWEVSTLYHLVAYKKIIEKSNFCMH